MKKDFYNNYLPEALTESFIVTMAQNAQYHLKINKKIDENIETY
jgi:hypothetical protein